LELAGDFGEAAVTVQLHEGANLAEAEFFEVATFHGGIRADLTGVREICRVRE
jgi:hypothetical protein